MKELLVQLEKCPMVQTLKEKTLHFATYPNVGRDGANSDSVFYPKGTIMPEDQANELGIPYRPTEGEWENHSIEWCGEEIKCFIFRSA